MLPPRTRPSRNRRFRRSYTRSECDGGLSSASRTSPPGLDLRSCIEERGSVGSTTMVQQADRTQAERAERNRDLKTTRVYHIDQEYADESKFREVALKGGVKPPVAYRTPGRGAIMGNNLVDRREVDSCHLIQ